LINQHIDQGCSSASTSKKATKLVQENLTPFFGSQRTKPQTPKNKRTFVQDASSPLAPTPVKRTKKAENLHHAMPLAEKLRPKSLKDFIGQEHLLGQESFLVGSNASMIFWGPPGYVTT
jgi:putative ATPase